MAILTHPLFSDVARGSVGRLITYKRNPRNPIACAFTDHSVNWTPAKIAQAQSFKSLCNQWRALSGEDRAAWSASAPGVLTGFNYFIQCNGLLLFDVHMFAWSDVSGAWLRVLCNSMGKLIVISE